MKTFEKVALIGIAIYIEAQIIKVIYEIGVVMGEIKVATELKDSLKSRYKSYWSK